MSDENLLPVPILLEIAQGGVHSARSGVSGKVLEVPEQSKIFIDKIELHDVILVTFAQR